MIETQTIDLAEWDTPPCPRCGSAVSSLVIEQNEDDFLRPATVIIRRYMNLQPCLHPINGYVLKDEKVEWMPYE